MKRVLLIAYYYPPLGGIGSQRSQKFARYLPEYGWDPVVLAPERGSSWVDPSLEDGKSRGIEVIRTSAINFGSAFKSAARRLSFAGAAASAGARAIEMNSGPNGNGALTSRLKRAVQTWIYIPDGQIGWYPYALRAGRQALETRDIAAIWSTSFPITAHLVAYRLKLATNKPWVADFRDLWTENQCANYSSVLRKRLDQIIESKLLEKVDALVTVSNTLAEALRRLTRGQKRIEVIRNGFDPADFTGIKPAPPEKWTITFVGSYYSLYDPSPFLAALRRLIDGGRISREDVLFNIVGERNPHLQDLVSRFGVADITRFTGLISHREALEHQINSSLLLFILNGEGATPGIITGKLYEYLGARRPILGITPPDFEAARIIRETGAGITLGAGDEAAIERHLVESYSAYKSGASCSNNDADLSGYERRYGARQLADLLTELTPKKAERS